MLSYFVTIINKKGDAMVSAARLEHPNTYKRFAALLRLVNDLVPEPLNIHHLVPQSRSLTHLRDIEENLVRLPRSIHDSWHALFANKTPLEVLQDIVATWAPAGYFQYIEVEVSWGREQCMWRPRVPRETRYFSPGKEGLEHWYRVFPVDLSYEQIVESIIRGWAPPSYFRRVHVVGAAAEVQYIWR